MHDAGSGVTLQCELLAQYFERMYTGFDCIYASVNSSGAHPPPGQPPGISIFFLKNGKFPGVGTSKSVKCPGVGPK